MHAHMIEFKKVGSYLRIEKLKKVPSSIIRFGAKKYIIFKKIY